MPPRVALSPTIEEYLEWIYRLCEGGKPVTTSELAHALGVSPASVTGMLKRLAERDLVEHKPYRQITLTKRGHAEASSLLRRHRLSERLLTDLIGMPWERAHEEACKFEHVIEGELEQQVSKALGHPTTCPHGHPLAAAVPDHSRPLCDLEPGETARIVRITDEHRDFLHYLGTLGLLPGTELTVSARAPFGGPQMVTVGNASYALGHPIAAKILVEGQVQSKRRTRRRRRKPDRKEAGG